MDLLPRWNLVDFFKREFRLNWRKSGECFCSFQLDVGSTGFSFVELSPISFIFGGYFAWVGLVWWTFDAIWLDFNRNLMVLTSVALKIERSLLHFHRNWREVNAVFELFDWNWVESTSNWSTFGENSPIWKRIRLNFMEEGWIFHSF